MCDCPHTPEIILLAVLLLTVGGSRVRPVMCLLCSNGRYSAMTNNWLLLWTTLWILPLSVPRQRRAGDTILTHCVSQLFRVLRQSWAAALTEKEMMKWWKSLTAHGEACGRRLWVFGADQSHCDLKVCLLCLAATSGSDYISIYPSIHPVYTRAV